MRRGSLVVFLARTGARIGEAQALRWADVDVPAATARIHASAFEKSGKGVVIGPTKTSRPRTVHLPPVVLGALQRLRGRFSPVPLDVGARFVFGTNDGLKPFRRSNMLRRRWHELLDSVRIERCGFHRLRHTFASLSLAAGSDIMTTSDAIGHKSAAFTLERYGHAIPDRQAEAAAKLEALLEAAARGREK